jgi:hypothetical protein
VRSEYWFTSRKGKFARIGYQVDDDVLAATRNALRIAVSGIASGVFPQRPIDDSGAYGCDFCTPDGRPESDVAQAWSDKSDAAELADYLQLIHPAGQAAR